MSGRTSFRRGWTDDQLETLRINFANWPTYLVAHVCGHSYTSTAQKAKKLGLKKSPEFLATPASGRLDGKRGSACRFQKGNVPANKGLRRPGWSPGRMAETQFKKGRQASEARNYVPIGTEKVDPKRGVLVRKLTDDPALFPVNRWRPVHVIVWEAEHGPVPKGHIVRFRAGMKTFDRELITVDKLELVTLAENMRRNSFHTNYPKEIGLVIQAKAVLTRTINKRAKADGRHQRTA